MTKKLIRDVLGSPIPQHYNEGSGFYVANTNGTGDASDVDFSKKKLLRDVLGGVIPQYYDVVEDRFKPVTSEGASGGASGPVSWDSVTGKPTTFNPSAHTHTIQEVSGLEEKLEKVFTQVSSGKSLLETAIIEKGSTVDKVGDVATFEELRSAIMAISANGGGGEVESKPYPDHRALTEGENFICLQRLGGEFVLLILEKNLFSIGFFLKESYTAGYTDVLMIDTTITYSTYRCNIKTNTPWIYINKHSDNLDYNLTSITESTTDIYDKKRDKVYFYRTTQL